MARTDASKSAVTKSIFQAPEPAFVVAVEAVSVDPQQDFDGVPGPLGDQRGGCSGVEPPGDPGVPEVARLAGQRRGELRRGERLFARLLQHVP